ncbi:hypothetical protein ACI65C_013749 [Semiaphis heraclei]
MAPRRKVRKCSINECESREDQTNVTLFKVYESNKVAWESAVHNAVNNQLRPLDYICSKHFAPDDVITNYSQTPSDVIMLEGCHKRTLFKLKKGSIPFVFDQTNISQPVPTAESACESPTHPSDAYDTRELYELKKITTPSAIKENNIFQPSPTAESFRKELFPASTVTLKRNIDCIYPTVTDTPYKQICLEDLQKPVFLNELVNSISLPLGWSTFRNEKTIVFYNAVFKMNHIVIEKQLVVTDDKNIICFVNNEIIEPASVGLIQLSNSINISNISKVISSFNYKQVCQGGPMAIHFPGLVLAQLVIKAICLLEKSGVIVNGVVSDRATTNCKLWSELGVTGEKGKESPDSNYIRWSQYVEVHKNDLERDCIAPLRVCPKITHRHLAPDSFSKMNVKLATQIFSNSMAKGIEYYRCHAKIKSLENSETTQIFTERINRLFDALNRRHPAEGIKHKSHDFDIKNTLVWLDLWEDHVLNHSISEEEFLSKSTAEGLRVTVKSTKSHTSTHLLDECGFKYVLTLKMNHDRLEQFVDMARQATDPNDHPNCPTFLQVYKLLSVYSIIKPPKSGNCTILDSTTPKLSIKDIKDVFSKNDTSERQLKIDHLKKRLDTLVAQDIEVDNVFQADIFSDHDYYKSDTESYTIRINPKFQNKLDKEIDVPLATWLSHAKFGLQSSLPKS